MTVLPTPVSSPEPRFSALFNTDFPNSTHEETGDVPTTLRRIGLFTWAVLSLHSFLIEPRRDALPPEYVLGWVVLSFVYLGLFLYTSRQTSRATLPRTLALLGLQSVVILISNYLLKGSSLHAGLMIVVAAQVSLWLPFRQTLLWMVAHSLGLFTILFFAWHNVDAWAFSTGYLCIQMLAAASVRTAMREVRARKQLALVVEELRATRELLNEATRQDERLHISRELHDVLGHHLTALGMNLQVGLHLLPEGSPARPHVQTAHQVGQQLLGDVRATVRGMRATSACHFTQEIKEITAQASLPIHLHFSEGFSVSCPVQALVLRRCVQEIITNTVRHAQAQQLWLSFTRDTHSLRVEARDDGHGAAHLRFGCGLSGMQERLDSVGGRLRVESAPGQGVRYFLSLPIKSVKEAK